MASQCHTSPCAYWALGVTIADTLMLSKRDGAHGAMALEPPGRHKEADHV
jgi:hypothetical protein